MTTSHPRYGLVLAFNRDEFYWRPTAPLSKWDSGVIAGRDLSSGGTWLAAARGRWAFVTNNRGGLAPVRAGSRKELSRGGLPVEFVTAERSAADAAQLVAAAADQFRPFHLVMGDDQGEVYWVNARPDHATVQQLPRGAVGFASEGGPDARWSKVSSAVADFDKLVENAPAIEDLQLFDLLGRRRLSFQSFPGIGETVLRTALSPRKVSLGVYGTRTTTILTIDRADGCMRMAEKTFRWARPSRTTRIVTF